MDIGQLCPKAFSRARFCVCVAVPNPTTKLKNINMVLINSFE